MIVGVKNNPKFGRLRSENTTARAKQDPVQAHKQDLKIKET